MPRSAHTRATSGARGTVRRHPGRVPAAAGLAVAALLLAACSGQAAVTAGPTTGGSPATGSSAAATPSATTSAATVPVTASATATPTTESPSPTPTPTVTPTATPTASRVPTATPTGTPARTATPTKAAPPDSTGPTLVAYYGTGSTDALGILGQGTPQQAWDAVAKRAKAYDRPGEPAVPMFEFIATVASSSPGRSGDYRNRVDDDVIGQYVKTATDNGGQVFLDIQPGRSDFLTEAKVLQKWLEMPNVGLALDPEWRMGPGQVPGRVIGSVNASEINEVSAWLDQLTADNDLPKKLFVVHQFTSSMIRKESTMADRPHLREITNVDGFGSQKTKLSKYHLFADESPYPLGLKLFTKKRNDPDPFTPAEAMAIDPRPVLINYQ